MLKNLMVALDECISVRFDSLREDHKFTIIRGNQRLCDTDDPEIALELIYIEKLREQEPDARICDHQQIGLLDQVPAIMIKHCKCGANMSCPICNFGWGTFPHNCEKE